MYQNIMVPLDGSPLAECVLPHVEALLQGCPAGGLISLVRVAEPFRLGAVDAGALSKEEWQQAVNAHQSAAREYLDRVAARLKKTGELVVVHRVVLSGPAAEALADWAKDNNVDLIVISTHGRSGVGRWVWGSVADRLLRSACTPVLMVRAPGCVPGI